MRPKTKKHKHFSRTDNKKYQEQNHKKEKTNNNHSLLLFLSHSRPLYSSHTTHHPTHNTHQGILLYQRGDFIEQQPCCSRYPTACHKTKQTKTQTHFAQTLQPTRLKDRKKPLSHQLPNHTHEVCGYLLSPANKKLATTRC